MKYLEILNDSWQNHLKPREVNAPTVISTFAGCGGSSLGYSMAGFKELLAIEWDDNAVKTFKHNFPDVQIYHDDIAKISVSEILERTNLKIGELDIFDGSPPCQGFSTAGKRKIDDDRNQLFKEYVRILNGLKPKVFVMENVSGMVKGSFVKLFAEILQTLKSCDYQVSVKLLNTKYFNVPQSRERMIFIGVRNDLNIKPTHPLPLTTKPFSLYEAIHDLPRNIQNPDIDHVWIDESPDGRNTKTWHKAKKAKCEQKYGMQQIRCHWLKPLPTIVKLALYLKTGNCHPEETRMFSTRELARCASFPDEFKFFDGKGNERIGNSVPPLFMYAIANHIKTNMLRFNELSQLV